jgi:O-acetyl-ADP-ribose deacetylase (regulator of RNase III)
MRTVKGDLLKLAKQGEFDIIIHGCNCFCVMGAGIARQIARTWPEALEVDRQTTPGAWNKLGNYTKTNVSVEGPNSPLTVINAYTQYKTGTEKRHLNYDALANVFERIKKDFGNQGLKFGIPRIGCGLAGGNPRIVKAIIEETMAGEDLTLVKFEQ